VHACAAAEGRTLAIRPWASCPQIIHPGSPQRLAELAAGEEPHAEGGHAQQQQQQQQQQSGGGAAATAGEDDRVRLLRHPQATAAVMLGGERLLLSAHVTKKLGQGRTPQCERHSSDGRQVSERTPI
jgi:hypothetical protein